MERPVMAESGWRMNEHSLDATKSHGRPLAAREFETGAGKVSYCPECRRIAVEFEGHALMFHRTGYDSFLGCLRDAIRHLFPAPAAEAVHIGPKDTDEFIRVDSGRIADLALLMEMAALVMDAEHPAA
jgi:hypothetical protein